jgi:hypothetical protein
MMNEAIENVCVVVNDVAPVPPVAPTDFTIILGAVMAGETMRGLVREVEALGGPEEALSVMLPLLEWIEKVFARCRGVTEDQGMLRGQVMVLGAAVAGKW